MDSHSIRTPKEVEAFLRHFLPKLEVLGIIFLNRAKNQEALKMLGIETIIDNFSYGDMWVFGKDCNGIDVYIKIALGKPNSNTICISFHTAEHPLKYAFKK